MHLLSTESRSTDGRLIFSGVGSSMALRGGHRAVQRRGGVQAPRKSQDVDRRTESEAGAGAGAGAGIGA
eukprot:7966338-Lingulodinium_polyedra.AAC.1